MHTARAVSSATAMATGAALPVIGSRVPHGLGIGCHIILVDGAPAAPPETIPSLLIPSLQIPSLQEGGRFRLAGITFTGTDIARFNQKALRASFAMKDGDWFDATAFGKGLQALTKQFAAGGYINFAPIPQQPKFDEVAKTVAFVVDLDLRKQFKVSRI